MCGLAGFSLAHTERCDAKELASALLLGIVDRGRHATGAAWHEDGMVEVQKKAVPATSFVHDLSLPRRARTAVLHTRWETLGSSRNIDNVHPIKAGPIHGTHNGMLSNHRELFAEIGPERRVAQVDSEAIFSALLHLPGPATRTLGRLTGSVAAAWLDERDDDESLHAARVSSSPLVCARTEAGSFLYASTDRALASAARRAGLALAGGFRHLDEGVLLRVVAGRVVDEQRFSVGRRRPMGQVERVAVGAA